MPSLTTSRAGFGDGLTGGIDTSSAISITGLRASLASAIALALDAVGEMGVYPVFSPHVVGVPSDGTADTGVRVVSVTFFQLALLDASDGARVVRGAGLRSGICIWGLFLSRRLGPESGALTTALIARVGVGVLTCT